VKKVALSELCSIQSGGTPSRGNEEYWAGGSIPWAKISDLEAAGDGYIKDTEEHITEEGLKAIRGRLFDNGTLLFAMYGSVGKTAIVKGEVSTNQAILGIKPITKQLDLGYLRYWLKSQQYVFDRDAQGVAQRNLSAGYIRGLKIPLPPLSEQKRIATILDKADAIRRKRQQAIQLADEFIRSVFLDMFGDPVTNSKGFEIKELSDFFIDNKNGTKCGPFGSALKKQEYTESGIPVWSMDNISLSGDFHDVPALWVSEEKFEELNSYSVLPGDVIISRAGTVGKMGVVRSHYEKSLISTNLIRVRFNERRLIPEYFVSLMTYCKGRVGRLKTGPDGAFTHMNTGILSSLTFPYPPVDLQKRFMEYRRKVISILDSSLEYEHEGLFALQSISRKAFSGTL
jgi:type I restriction enzyme S subunit